MSDLDLDLDLLDFFLEAPAVLESELCLETGTVLFVFPFSDLCVALGFLDTSDPDDELE